MNTLSKTSKIIIGVVLVIALILIGFVFKTAIQNLQSNTPTTTAEGTNGGTTEIPFGASDMPLDSELQPLGLEKSVKSDSIGEDYKLHNYSVDLMNKAITYNYYTKDFANGEKLKVVTYGLGDADFQKVIPKKNITDTNFDGVVAKYYEGTYYYVSDDYTIDATLQKAIDDGSVVLEKGNDLPCEIGTVKNLYWYKDNIGYCLTAINMPSVNKDTIIQLAEKYSAK